MTPVETVQDIYAAFGRGDVDTILSHLSDDVEWEWEAVDHGIPWLKPGKGKHHVAQFFQSLAVLEFSRFEPFEFLAGGNSVVTAIRYAATSSKNGRRIHDTELHHFTFNDQGKVSRFRHFADTHQHFEAC